ncbi:MAG: DUF2339 domain-containing protein, partial [Nitrospirota bacterium]|nr:DUF2339 domain-containing protein [Nitrospirota bacterium]
PNGLAGGGIVVLYAAFWAAAALYHLIPLTAAFVLMALVTATGGLLAVRHGSLVIAVMGLVGGFLTPFLLSSGADRPIGLFGYLLLLNVGVFFVARMRHWNVLAGLSLVGTGVYELLWITTRMGPDRVALGIGILVVFMLLFVLAGRSAATEDRAEWLPTQSGAILLPLLFAFYFAGNAPYSPHLYPVALLLLLLSGAATWIAKTQDRAWLGLAAAGGNIGVTLVWLGSHPLTHSLTVELVAISVAFAALFHAWVERDPERADMYGPAQAAVLATIGQFGCLIVAAGSAGEVPPWPFVAGFLALAALLIRHAGFPEREWLHVPAGVATAIGLAILHLTSGGKGFPAFSIYLGLLVAVSLLFQGVLLLRRAGVTGIWAGHAAAAVPLILLLSIVSGPDLRHLSPVLALGGTLALAAVGVLATAITAPGGWYLALAGVTAVVHLAWTDLVIHPSASADQALLAMAWQMAAVLFFTAWPFAVPTRYRSERWALYGAALAGSLWFFSLKTLYIASWGRDSLGLLPVVLGAVSLTVVFRSSRLWPPGNPLRKSALVWFSAVAMGFVSIAIPLQLQKEWITIGWAIQGAAVILLWRRLNHPGLKYFGLALLAAVTIRLVANPAVLGYYTRSGWPILNWLLYTYWIPAAALIATAVLLRPKEISRLREWELPFFQQGHPWGAAYCGLAGLVVFFVWINLAIADWFSGGRFIELHFERMPARDLTTSVTWVLYALLILVVGVWRKIPALRWVSLSLLMVTIAKVFLYDLGKLEDLYRVASLVGLAVSLILVSFGYQRFVFRRQREP